MRGEVRNPGRASKLETRQIDVSEGVSGAGTLRHTGERDFVVGVLVGGIAGHNIIAKLTLDTLGLMMYAMA